MRLMFYLVFALGAGIMRMNNNTVTICLIMVYVLALTAVVSFWGTMAYVAWHFISKYW